MKNYKRAERRHKKYVKFIGRLKNWIKPGESLFIDNKRIVSKSREDVIQEALKGNCYIFLRTTGRPCSCYSCSYYKYKREQRQYIKKQIDKEL